MASGYTECISKGITFQQFALQCARAFGATITMRDEPMSAEIPDEFPPSDYYVKRLEEERRELVILKAMSLPEAEGAAKGDYDRAVAVREAETIAKNELRAKYEAMLSEVEKWQPPTPDHHEMKRFMEKQIQESISWDCEISEEPIVLLSGREWLSQKIEACSRKIQFYTDRHAAEVALSKGRTEWVRALKTSLKEN
jgi:hypothetical protein